MLVDKGAPVIRDVAWPARIAGSTPTWATTPEAFKSCMLSGTEYVGNADWYQAWIDDSKDAYERLSSWGILDQYTRAVDTPDYFENLDYVGIAKRTSSTTATRSSCRRLKTTTSRGRLHHDHRRGEATRGGRVGFHVPSGTVITFNAKAVVMCMGAAATSRRATPWRRHVRRRVHRLQPGAAHRRQGVRRLPYDHVVRTGQRVHQQLVDWLENICCAAAT
ncbi:MAG: hypothetical protein ACLSVD_11755 [Eggerthellaceae bacterium]